MPTNEIVVTDRGKKRMGETYGFLRKGFIAIALLFVPPIMQVALAKGGDLKDWEVHKLTRESLVKSIIAKELAGWRVNDLTKESIALREFTHGAVATIVPRKGESIPTIFVFKASYNGPRLGKSIPAWEQFVRKYTDAGDDRLRKERAYVVDGQSRFYVEAMKNETLVEGPQMLYSAMLLIMRRKDIVMLDFSAPKSEFRQNIHKVLGVYRRIRFEE